MRDGTVQGTISLLSSMYKDFLRGAFFLFPLRHHEPVGLWIFSTTPSGHFRRPFKKRWDLKLINLAKLTEPWGGSLCVVGQQHHCALLEVNKWHGIEKWCRKAFGHFSMAIEKLEAFKCFRFKNNHDRTKSCDPTHRLKIIGRPTIVYLKIIAVFNKSVSFLAHFNNRCNCLVKRTSTYFH